MEIELRDEYPVVVNGKIMFPLTSIIGNTKETRCFFSELERENAKRDFVENVIPRIRDSVRDLQFPET